MAEPGKSKFSAFLSLAETIKKEDKPVTDKNKDTGVTKHNVPSAEKKSEIRQKETDSTPRIKKPPLTDEMQAEIIRLAAQIAEKAALQKLYGRRSNYKGPRITRSYKIDVYIDNWLDAIAKDTGIEKSTIVTNAIREYIKERYSHLKPEEIQPEE